MYRMQRGIITVAYLAGLFGFALSNIFTQSQPSALSALEYGAQWPVYILRLI